MLFTVVIIIIISVLVIIASIASNVLVDDVLDIGN